jgi:hypothetical protein
VAIDCFANENYIVKNKNWTQLFKSCSLGPIKKGSYPAASFT